MPEGPIRKLLRGEDHLVFIPDFRVGTSEPIEGVPNELDVHWMEDQIERGVPSRLNIPVDDVVIDMRTSVRDILYIEVAIITKEKVMNDRQEDELKSLCKAKIQRAIREFTVYNQTIDVGLRGYKWAVSDARHDEVDERYRELAEAQWGD